MLASDTEEGNRFKSSMKTCTKGSELFFITNLRTFVCKEHYKIAFIPARNKMTEIVHPANILC